MSLSGLQHKQIQDALVAAFGNEDNMRQMLKFQMNLDLDSVAKPGNMAQRTFDVVTWADNHGRVSDLVQGAINENPTSPELQSLAEVAAGWHIEAAAPAETSPYKGLAFYDRADAALFFGRETLTAELVAYLKDHRFLAVVGASGSGKSSVVRAGVVPTLHQGDIIKGSDKWAVFVVTPTARPLTTLAASLTQDSESVTAQATLMDDMSKDPRSLDLFASRLAAKTKASRLLLVVDQFEELFTLCKDNTEQQAYVDNLLAAAVPEGVTTVILTLRADFYARCAEFDNLRLALQDWQKYIGPMSRDELRAAIEKPAAKDGWDFEPRLVDAILDDMEGEAGALPLLSQALTETWKRRSGRTMTFAGYDEAGGVHGAIAKTADAVYAELAPQQQAITRNIFLRLTALGEGTQDTRRRVPLPELLGSGDHAAQVQAVLKLLEDERLVTAERAQVASGAGETSEVVYVDVTHEALIGKWPRLDSWLHEDREGLLVHRRLTEAAQDWAHLGRDPGSLFRGVRLAQTSEWVATHNGDLNDLEREFVNASQAQVDAERRDKERIQLEREETQQRELEQAHALAAEQQRRAQEQAQAAASLRKRNGVLVIALVAALALASVAALFYTQANAERQNAVNAQATAQANENIAVNAKATAQANLTLANKELDRQNGTTLLKMSVDLAASGKFTDAIATYDKAIAADPTLPVKAEDAITGTIRIAATKLITEGEELARSGDHKGASDKFRQALALNPPPDTPVYVWIEPGEFLMGSTDEQCKEAGLDGCPTTEQPTHTVQLDGYWMRRTEVTNEQYRRCVDAGKCDKPRFAGWDKPQAAKQPVTYVDWTQASQYAAWVGGRLPTEAEWEYACQGGDSRIYPWGNEAPAPERLNYDASGYKTAIDVGGYAPGANGLYDMAGNVWEWTADWYGESYYEDSPPRNPTGPTNGDSRTLRGGSFNLNDFFVRCASRHWYHPVNWYYYFGFRVLSPGS